MAWIWFFMCCARGREVDRFYTYLGLGQFLIPQRRIFNVDDGPSVDK